MRKNTAKNLVGQPIFKQILKILPKEQFDMLVKQHQTDRYYKTFFSWDQLIVMLFGIFSRCDSMGEVYLSTTLSKLHKNLAIYL